MVLQEAITELFNAVIKPLMQEVPVFTNFIALMLGLLGGSLISDPEAYEKGRRHGKMEVLYGDPEPEEESEKGS